MRANRLKAGVGGPERPLGLSPPALSFAQALRALGFVAAMLLVSFMSVERARAQTKPAAKPAAKSAVKAGGKTAPKTAQKTAPKPSPKAAAATGAAAQPSAAAFQAFIASLWPQASARSVSRRTFDRALGDVSFDAGLLRISAKQAEFVRPVWDYLGGAITEQRISKGREMAARYANLLTNIERQYGADPYVVLSIWGMETSYGSFVGDKNVFRSLATLAYASERKDFFRDELLTALQILEQDNDLAGVMTGSWAGAMGHTQFMPSSFMKYAVDQDGDGHRNIWQQIPDALGSTANYLVQHGWVRGMTWGYEVTLPNGFDVSGHDPQTMRGFSQWAALGLRRADGQAMPTGGEGALLLPAGVRGPAFLVTSNFRVIRAYNNSAAYMLAVALLSDRIAGAGPLKGAWPRGDKPLSTSQAMEIQRTLNRLGFDAGKVDGRIGEQVQTAIRAYQRRNGLVADGYATQALLAQMKKAR